MGADGSLLPPLIVFKGAGVQARWTSEQAYPGTLYTLSKNISFVFQEQILGVLPVPTIKMKGERIFYHFEKKVPCIHS